MGGINYRQGSVHAEDSANKVVVNRPVHKDMRFMLFTIVDNAQWAADRAVRAGGVPLREAAAVVNRYHFNLTIGSLLKITSAKYNITDVVFRVMNIKEESLESEKITLSLLEDFNYISQQVVTPPPASYGKAVDYSIAPLIDVKVVEAPYVLVGEKNAVIPLVSRIKGTEIGYVLFMSTDSGTSYSELDSIESFVIHGTLTDGLDISVNTLDKAVGFDVDFDVDNDAMGIDTIERGAMISGDNLALIISGDQQEIISFETITPDPDTIGRYFISDIYRGRYDTIKGDWSAGADFYYIGSQPTIIEDANIYYGAFRAFKFVPFNNSFIGDISDASPATLTITGRPYKPYIPGNFRANGENEITIGGATYSTTIDLTWSPRIRGQDAGINDPDSITDAAPTWEGLFEVEAWIGGVLKNTDTAINATSATYSQATIEGWNSGVLPDEITFKLLNYIVTDTITYKSAQRELTVTKV